jgi:hypothetical protein
MTTTTTTSFHIDAVPTPVLDEVRESELDVSGNAIEHVMADGGEPLRCCLRDAFEGERLILFGYAPDIPSSPYREIGPVFVHAEQCDGPVAGDEYPTAWLGRPQVLRAYDARGWIHPSTRVHDGSDRVRLIEGMLADPDVVQIHSRNVAYGCYMFKVTRMHADGPGYAVDHDDKTA